MEVKFIKERIPVFSGGGKGPETAEPKKTVKPSEEDFLSGSGTFDIEEAIASLAGSGLSESRKSALERRMRRMVGKGDSSIDVRRTEDGTVQWRWQDGSGGEGRKGGVADSQRKANGIGGKGVLGVSGGIYDEAYDYMVKNGYVKFNDGSVKVKEKPKAGEPAADTKAPGEIKDTEAYRKIQQDIDLQLEKGGYGEKGTAGTPAAATKSGGTGKGPTASAADPKRRPAEDTTGVVPPVNPNSGVPEWQGAFGPGYPGRDGKGYSSENTQKHPNGILRDGNWSGALAAAVTPTTELTGKNGEKMKVTHPDISADVNQAVGNITGLFGANGGKGYTIEDAAEYLIGDNWVSGAVGGLTSNVIPAGPVKNLLLQPAQKILSGSSRSAAASHIKQARKIKDAASKKTGSTNPVKTPDAPQAPPAAAVQTAPVQPAAQVQGPSVFDSYFRKAKDLYNKATTPAQKATVKSTKSINMGLKEHNRLGNVANQRGYFKEGGKVTDIYKDIKLPSYANGGGIDPVKRPALPSPPLNTPEFTTRELNPKHMPIQRMHYAKDGRFGTYTMGPGANYDVNMKAVGTPDRNFNINGAGVENIYEEQYRKPMSRKELEEIGFNAGAWKGAKKVGEYSQDGQVYPIVHRGEEIRQHIDNPAKNSGTDDYTWSASGRKLKETGVGRALSYKKKHGL